MLHYFQSTQIRLKTSNTLQKNPRKCFTDIFGAIFAKVHLFALSFVWEYFLSVPNVDVPWSVRACSLPLPFPVCWFVATHHKSQPTSLPTTLYAHIAWITRRDLRGFDFLHVIRNHTSFRPPTSAQIWDCQNVFPKHRWWDETVPVSKVIVCAILRRAPYYWKSIQGLLKITRFFLCILMGFLQS